MEFPIEVGQIVEGKEVLDVKELPHIDDVYLRLVFVKYRGQYVSYLYNADFGGFHYGRYAETREQGERKYAEHCACYKIK